MALPLSCRERRGKTLESIRSCRLLLVGLTTLVRNTRKRCSRQDGKDAKNVFVSLRGVAAALGQVMNPGSDLYIWTLSAETAAYHRSLPIAQRSRLARYSRDKTMRIATAR